MLLTSHYGRTKLGHDIERTVSWERPAWWHEDERNFAILCNVDPQERRTVFLFFSHLPLVFNRRITILLWSAVISPSIFFDSGFVVGLDYACWRKVVFDHTLFESWKAVLVDCCFFFVGSEIRLKIEPVSQVRVRGSSSWSCKIYPLGFPRYDTQICLSIPFLRSFFKKQMGMGKEPSVSG